jgi:hypothetical protein
VGASEQQQGQNRTRDRAFARRAFMWLAVLVLPLFALAADGRFEVRSAYVELSQSIYELNATLDVDLPEGARAAVREGVPLTLQWEIVVRRGRKYWFDQTVATLDQRYEVVFHALSERYLVRNVNSGEQASYPTLDAALDALRVVSSLPILDRSLIDPTLRHEVSVRANLDVRTMPDALRFVLFWTDDWRRRSEWYTWSPQF